MQPWTAVTGWDTAYYIELSHNGYHHNLSVAFFPLFPAAIWLVREVLHTGDAVTAMLVSNGAALIAMFGLYVLARDRLSEAHARRTLLYLVLSPYAFALVFAYSEGIFLALTVWLFVLSDRHKDGWAIPLAFLTGLTRITGAALVPALLIRAWRRKTVEAWLLAIAPAVGLAAHAAWLWHAVGDPLAMVKIQSEWGGHLSFPLWPLIDQFWRFATTHDVFYLARGVTVIAYLLLLIPIWKSARFRATRDEDVRVRVRHLHHAAALQRALLGRPLRPGRVPADVRAGRPRPAAGDGAPRLRRVRPHDPVPLTGRGRARLPAAVNKRCQAPIIHYLIEKLEEPIAMPLGCALE